MNGMASLQEMAELDLNDPLFKTDAFMVYGFKVLPCRRTRRHDWRECPFAHPGEVARRRDPRVYTYVGIICPDAKQNSPCPRGDRCPYTHSLFEYWLHPTRYKTEFCSRGSQCTRPFCFFAHSETDMRPVDTEALLAVAMRPNVEPTINQAVAQTADLLQRTSIFSPVSRTPIIEDGLHRFSSESNIHLRSPAIWGPFYTPIPTDIRRRYSASDVFQSTPSSDLISSLGLRYLQNAQHQVRLASAEMTGFSRGPHDHLKSLDPRLFIPKTETEGRGQTSTPRQYHFD